MELQHRYVARALAELPGVTAIVVTQQAHLSIFKRFRRASKRFGLWGALSRVLLKLTLRVIGESSRREADLARVLGKSEFPNNVPIFKTIGINSAQTQAMLRGLTPDILCVYGTYIVSDDTLSIASELALNLHTGLSPRYRGADCEFSPLHERELNFLGATVHTCTSDVDGGAIFGTAAATLEANDRLGAVFGRCVIAGTALYKRMVDDLINGREIQANPQDLSTGREYRVAMRGWAAELRVARLILGGLIQDSYPL
jgi:folate-dependent phosphoribosylglycinamide formyltransferase PurN